MPVASVLSSIPFHLHSQAAQMATHFLLRRRKSGPAFCEVPNHAFAARSSVPFRSRLIWRMIPLARMR